MLASHHRMNFFPNCGGVPWSNQQRCSSVLERVGQLTTGGNDQEGCSSIIVLVPTDFRRGNSRPGWDSLSSSTDSKHFNSCSRHFIDFHLTAKFQTFLGALLIFKRNMMFSVSQYSMSFHIHHRIQEQHKNPVAQWSGGLSLAEECH